MSTDAHNLPHLHNLDTEIVARYTDQPPRLPAELRRQVEASWNGAPVQLYALADLDHALRLTQVWVALGPGRLAMARRVDRGEQWEIESVERAHIQAVREAPGLSASTLTILGRPGDPPLAVLRYSHRQRRAFENLKFVLEEALEGRDVAAPDADQEYAASVAGPIRDAQALVAGRQVAVIRRLLGYLAPYRRRLTLGMAAATLITLVSLVPPYLAGYVIDRVVRPPQEGRLDGGRAAMIAWLAVAAMALVYVVRQAAALVRLRLMAVLGEWVARDLRAELYEHLQRLSLAFFSRKRTGSLITRVSADTDRLWDFLAFGVVDVSLSLVMLAGLGAVLVSLDWRLGLVMTLPVPLFCWAIYRHGEALNRVFLRVWRKWSRLTDVLSDTMPGIRVVKAFNQEAREVARFDGHNDDVTDEINRLHGLVGPSGGGKTTIVNLIARFYDVTGGAIRIDGVDLRRLETGHYRRQIGMVLQDSYLFHGTVLENIRYGLPGASLEQAVAAAKAANAHDFICKLQHGYDTVVGERGHTLSGGERQRVSIARAILHDPRILILDEATSSVDTETEREIQEAWERLIAGRTVFAIAHRLSTLRKASRLFVIADGRLVESGRHAELMAKTK